VLRLTPLTSRSRESKVEQAGRKISRILAELDEENGAYGREFRNDEVRAGRGAMSIVQPGRRGSPPRVLRGPVDMVRKAGRAGHAPRHAGSTPSSPIDRIRSPW